MPNPYRIDREPKQKSVLGLLVKDGLHGLDPRTRDPTSQPLQRAEGFPFNPVPPK